MDNDAIAMNLTIAAVDRWVENSSASSGQEVGREIAAMYREIYGVLEQISPEDDEDDDEDDEDEPAIRPPLSHGGGLRRRDFGNNAGVSDSLRTQETVEACKTQASIPFEKNSATPLCVT